MTAGNEVTVHEDGDALFESMFEDIASAREEVLVETYILEADRVGLRLMELLEQAAGRGCRVALLCDGVGSMAFPAGRLAEAGQRGVWTGIYNPPLGWSTLRRRAGLLHRDHRKLLVVDGRIAYTGGANIGEDYAGPRLGTGRFDDTHLRISGPAAAVLRGTLWALLGRCGMSEASERGTGAGIVAPPASGTADAGTAIVQVLESHGRLGKREIQRELRLAIECAVGHIEIATPYFVPTQRILDALVAAARRGVRIRLLTAGRSDVPMVAFAARHVYERLLRRGIEVFEMESVTLHAKTATIDGLYGLVGSANLDQWSFHRNLELNVGLVGESALGPLQSGFERRIGISRRVDLATHVGRPHWRRLLEWCAYRLMRL